MTIRASQVMPLYPLEEDIRPGDIFLTNQSIDDEITSWNQKGFLPLINRFDRIPISQDTYDHFYNGGFAQVDGVSFSRAPNAAFPSYSFEVDQRGGVGLAIPLASVPLALSASGAQSAIGNVVFKKATTQGLPDLYMEYLIAHWASDKKEDLKRWASGTKNPLLLRVISRTFSVSEADVSLSFAETTGARIQAGAPPDSPGLVGASSEDFAKLTEYLNSQIQLTKEAGEPPTVEIPDTLPGQVSKDKEIADLRAQLARLQKLKAQVQLAALERQIERSSMIDQFGGYLLPGAMVRVVGRSARGAALKEIFAKPLVLGYWALEYLVGRSEKITLLGRVIDPINDPAKYQQRVEQLASRIAAAPLGKPAEVVDYAPDKEPSSEK